MGQFDVGSTRAYHILPRSIDNFRVDAEHLPLCEPGADLPPDFRPNASFHLSPKTIAVWRLICAGYSNKQIGLKLGISEQTVKNYVTILHRTTGVTSRIQLVLMSTIVEKSIFKETA